MSIAYLRAHSVQTHEEIQEQETVVLPSTLGSEGALAVICMKGCFEEAAVRRLQAGRTSAMGRLKHFKRFLRVTVLSG